METTKTISLRYNEEKYRYWVKFSTTDQLYWISLGQVKDFVLDHLKQGYTISMTHPPSE